jgi:deoxyadenosine/deoxycytidine kinase
VTGTIGSGATTLARVLAGALGGIPLVEADAGEANPFFARMYADLRRWGFASQVHFLVESAQRHRELVRMRDRPGGAVVEDRTPFEHRAVYLRVQEELGLLPHDELETLTELALVLERGFVVPDVLVYRRTPRRVADERIRRRARPGEEHMDREWLVAVDAAFEGLATSWAGPVVVADEALDVADAAGVAALAREVMAARTPR